jgi:hypothetical protein
MFFEFDPLFRAEIEGARVAWCGTAAPPDRRGWSDIKRFDYEAAAIHDEHLRALAAGLARRWGLDTTDVVHALATGRGLNYPYYRVRTDLEDQETGLVYSEVRVYSEYVWAKVKSGLLDVRPKATPPVPRLFPDATSGRRSRGMTSHVAARAMALYFLTEAGPGLRPTGGRRTATEAEKLWRERSPDLDEKGDRWAREQRRLLSHVARRRPDPVARLMDLQMDSGLGDDEWASALGVELAGPDGSPSRDTWHGTRSGVRPSTTFWDRVISSLPDQADDLTFDLWALRQR